MDSAGLIYLVRCGATDNDASNYPVMPGQRNDGLSLRGYEQANRLGDYFSSKGVSAIYCSGLSSAVQTADAIWSKCAGVKGLTFCPSLREANMGDWEGETEEEIFEADPDRWLAFQRDPVTYGYPGGENLGEVARRSLALLNKLAVDHSDDRIVVVAHKHVNRAVLAHLMGQPMSRLREIDQDPGCVNVIRVFRGVMGLEAVNFTQFDQLEEEECTSHSSTHVLSA